MVVAADLKQQVKDAVAAKMSAREAFTTVDISHPLIAADSSIRHSQVRAIINEMWGNGDFEGEFYTASSITVYPKPTQPQTARLFHPDEPTFDPSSYTSVTQELTRTGNSLTFNKKMSSPFAPVRSKGFDVTDGDGDDGSSSDGSLVLAQSATGAKVQAQCEIQQKNAALNVPRILVSKAGLSVGSPVQISVSGGVITIKPGGDPTKDQVVDKEGRIRVYGKNLAGLGKSQGQACQALLVDDNGQSYIQIQ